MMQRMLKTAEPTMVPTPTSPWVIKTPAGTVSQHAHTHTHTMRSTESRAHVASAVVTNRCHTTVKVLDSNTRASRGVRVPALHFMLTIERKHHCGPVILSLILWRWYISNSNSFEPKAKASQCYKHLDSYVFPALSICICTERGCQPFRRKQV